MESSLCTCLCVLNALALKKRSRCHFCLSVFMSPLFNEPHALHVFSFYSYQQESAPLHREMRCLFLRHPMVSHVTKRHNLTTCFSRFHFNIFRPHDFSRVQTRRTFPNHFTPKNGSHKHADENTLTTGLTSVSQTQKPSI